MKVKCIENSVWENLTIGKTYVVIPEDEDWYWVINDKGKEDLFPIEWFKTIAEYRNDKIDKLLEDES